MQKIIAIMTALLLLTSCVHKMTVQQGNIIDQNLVSKLHTGMSREAVKDVMGAPVLINTFNDDRINYIYTLKPGYGPGTEKTVTLLFQGDHLKRISQSTDDKFGK